MPKNYAQEIRFRAKQEERTDEFNFVGGYFTDAHETKLETNQSPNLKNIIYNDTGSIKTIGGYQRYNPDLPNISADQQNIYISLVDNFNDNSVDTAKWGNSFDSLATYTETGGRARITLSTTSGNYASYRSTTTYSLIGSSAVVDVPTMCNTGEANAQAYFRLGIDDNNYVQCTQFGGTLYFQKRVAGATTDVASVTYNSTTHKWWRIRESGGTTYWDTSTDGSSWTNRASNANPITLTALTVDLAGGTFGATTSPGFIEYDNFTFITTGTASSEGSLAIDALTDYVAQTFQPSGTVDITQVGVYLAMQTSGQEQNVRLEIWSTTAGVPNTLITNGQSQIKLISGTSETLYDFKFLKPVALTTGTTYAIVVKPYTRSNQSAINQVNLHYTGDDYMNGSVYTSTNAAVSWSADLTKDLKFTVSVNGNTPITGLSRFYTSTGVKQSFSKIGNTLYRGNDSTGALTAITLPASGTFATANFIDYTTVNNTLLVVDGTNSIRKYRGSTNANYTTGTISVTQGDATVTGSGTSWSTTTNAVVGEYIQLPDSKWYKIVTINSNTSLEIEIDYPNSTLSGQSYIISPWGNVEGKLNSTTATASLVDPKPSFIENHANRVWTLEGNTLRFSVLDTSVTEEHFNDFDSSNNAGTIIIPSSGGDSCTGMYSANGYLYIWQRNALWELFGTSPNNFELRNISNEIGMINRRTLVEYDRYLIFLSDKGVYIFDGANLINLTENKINNFIDTWANKTNCSATLWGNRYLLAYTPSGETSNSEAIFYDIKREVWGKKTNFCANVFVTWNGSTDDNRIYFGSSNQSSIYRWDSGTNDDGYPIELLYDTPSMGIGANVNDKTIKKFYLQTLASGDYDISVTMFTDISNSTSGSVNLSGGNTSLWDVMEWDTDTWSGEGDIVTERIAEFQGIAKFFKFRFEQTDLDSPVEILGMTATHRVRRLI